jgi:epoxyqueuosine reductase
MTDPRPWLTALAHEAGFHHVRFAAVGPTPHGDAFARWLDAGWDGEMASWTRPAADVRLDPRVRRPDARTAMVLGVEHHHRRPPDPGGRTGLVARYAWGRDYHNLVGKRLRKLQRRLTEHGLDTWGGVDTAPILERSWAAEAGLGFSGKNSVQIWPARTSWMFLAVVFLPLEVPPDAPLRDHCGRCARCLTACPTGAFRGPRELDATACVAYWTIEARGLPPRALRAGFGRWVFGCDVCQEVCPHNAAPPDPEEDDLLPRHAWLDLDEVVLAPDEALMARFLGTPLRRPGAAGLKRNALIALANLGDEGAVPTARHALHHPSGVVRAAAVWCLRALGAAPRLPGEADPSVRAELDAAD